MANGESGGWMSDVQRGIALILVVTFALAVLFATYAGIRWPDAAQITDMAKTLQAALVNMALIALGFFFGSNMSKVLADAGQQKIVEKLTSTAPPGPPGPVAPLPGPMPWWGALTPAEQAAITTAAAGDAKVMAFVTAANVGKASVGDLADLVARGLLTQARADEIGKL